MSVRVVTGWPDKRRPFVALILMRIFAWDGAAHGGQELGFGAGLLFHGTGRRNLLLRRCPVPRLPPGLGIDSQTIDLEAVPEGQGYYLLGPDGGVFGFGSATFFGSLPGIGLVTATLDMEVKTNW